MPEGSVAVTLVTDGVLFGSDASARTRGGASVYGCYAATPTETGGHDLSRARLHFPDEVIRRADGRRRIVMFMTDKPLGAERREPGLAQTVRCVIPDDDEAARLADVALGASGKPLWPATPPGAGGASARRACYAVLRVSWSRTCITWNGDTSCPWVRHEDTVIECDEDGGGSGSGSDPCDSGQLMPPADQQGMGCNYPGGGGPGLPTDPLPTDPEPCQINSSSPVLNALNPTDVQQAMDLMWEESNPNADDLIDRKEMVGLLIPNGDGTRRLVPLPPQLYIDQGYDFAAFKTPAYLPPGTVLVHTHPFSPGERKFDRVIQRFVGYDPSPSQKDRNTLETLGLETGLFLDGGKIQVFGQTKTQDGPSVARCGYGD